MSSGPATRMEIKDSEVRELVVDQVGRSFIVQAPAGSGKTELLTQRFLALLATVEDPESVLAITFTRKAASEMRIRILEALDSAGERLSREQEKALEPHKRRRRELAKAVLEADARRGWHLLENPVRLQIRTVDSLADSIARQLPMLAGMSAELSVTEDASEWLREAAERTIAELGGAEREAEAISTLLRYRDNKMSEVRKLLVSMLAKRDQWLRIISTANTQSEGELAQLKADLEDALRQAVEEDLRKVRAGLVAVLGSDARELVRFSRIASGRDDGPDELPLASANELDAWRAIAELTMTQDGSIRKSITVREGLTEPEDKNACKALLKSLGERAEDAERVCALLTKVRKLPTAKYTEDEWRFVRALLVALPRAAAYLKIVFAEAGQVDFIEMATAAKTALETEEGPTELGLAVGSQLKHLLVDEFQDTSQSQLALINALTRTWEEDGGNTLFLVGDPMQSIYAFREAEVTIFMRAFSGQAKGVRDLRWPVEPLKLKSNFRSQRGLVDWFNRTHSEVLTRDDDATGAVSYAEATAVKDEGAGAVTLKGFAPKDYAAEAAYIAEQVQNSLAEDSKQTIAILVKARPHLAYIVRELQRRKIDFRAVKVDELAKRQVVLDLDALAKAVLDAADRTSWLAVLRAPWCGLTLADLWELCRGDHASTVVQLLKERMRKLSADGQRRATAVLKAMEVAVRDASTIPLRLVVERAWTELGGPATFDADKADACARDAAAYLDFLEQQWAVGVRPGTRQFDTKLGELYAPASTDPNIRVELMTIHGAKGLEWDVVFLPGLGRAPRNDDKQMLYWRERSVGNNEQLLLGPMRSVKVPDGDKTIESYLQSLAKEREKEEKKRLLYVATTRAKKKLYLTATLGQKGDPAANSLLALIWPVNDAAASMTEGVAPGPATSTTRILEPKPLRRLPGAFVIPPPPERLKAWNKGTADLEEETLHTFNWAGETRRRVGTVTHAFLQAIARDGVEKWNATRVAASKKAIRTALMTEGVGPQSLESATNDVTSALINALDDERGRWILAARDEAWAEFALTTFVDGEPRRMKIDRTFVEGNVRWLVDYKTTEIEGGDREKFFADQVTKYRDDLARYADALRKVDSREIRCALYFPLQKELRVVAFE